MAVKLSPYQFFGTDANGNPLSGYKLFTYSAGSSTKSNTYQESAGSTAHANPIILSTLGFPPAPIWLTEGQTYKFVLASPSDTDPPTGTVRTFDNISGVNDAGATTLDQWIASGLTPTYIAATQFSLAGDQTSTFHVGRRVKTTNSGGTRYGTITASVYGAVTTVTVSNDSGSLDSGISAVSYGVLSVTNPSVPGELVALLGLTSAADKLPYFTGANTAALADFNSVARTFIGQTTQAAMRATGLGFSADTYLGGAWTTPAFSAGDFTGSGAMTWTLVAGDVSTFAYMIDGKKMTVSFYLLTTTVGGVADDTLRIAIPASKTATKTMLNACYISDNGTPVIGTCRVVAAGTSIEIQRTDGADFTAATDATSVLGQITFEIN